MGDGTRGLATWRELFERAEDHETSVAEIRAALDRRREERDE